MHNPNAPRSDFSRLSAEQAVWRLATALDWLAHAKAGHRRVTTDPHTLGFCEGRAMAMLLAAVDDGACEVDVSRLLYRAGFRSQTPGEARG